MTVTAVEAPKAKRKVPDHILDTIIETNSGFWLTTLLNGEKFMERPANDLEIATWRQRDRERKEAAEEEKAERAQEAYDMRKCGTCGLQRLEHEAMASLYAHTPHEFNEEPWVEPVETVPRPVIEGNAVYDSSAEGDEPKNA